MPKSLIDLSGVDGASRFGPFKATVTRTTRLTAAGGTSEWTEESRDPLQRSFQTAWSGTTSVASRTYFPAAASGSRHRIWPARDADTVPASYTYNTRAG